jgi:hypothetical protein
MLLADDNVTSTACGSRYLIFRMTLSDAGCLGERSPSRLIETHPDWALRLP